MLIQEILLLLTIGAFAGLLAGLFGVGGGLVIVPLYAWLLETQGTDPSVLMHVAIGTSLATIVITSLSSIRAHQSYGAIRWDIFRRITPGIVVGALLGAAIADYLPGETLRLVFVTFIFIVAIQMATGIAASPNRDLPRRTGITFAGTVIGSLSAIVGIGGGTMSVPFMVWCNIEVRKAVATSAAIGLPIALAGAAGYIAAGWSEAARPLWSLGYVSLPAFGAIVIASSLCAPLGAKLAHSLPRKILKRLFALLLLGMGLRMSMAA